MNVTDARDRIEARNAALPGSVVDDVDLSDARFENVNLARVQLEHVDMTGVSFTNANLTGMTMEGSRVADPFAAYRANNR